MDTLLRNTVLITFVWLMLAGVCLGKQVHLKDGSILDGQSAWRRGDKVFVKVNRDIIADFNLSEIDLGRTFPETRKKQHHVRHKKPAVAVPQQVAAAAVVKAAATPTSAPAPVAPQSPAATPAVTPVATPSPNPPLAANETVQPGQAQAAPADPSAPPDKAELERRGKQAAQMMAEAIQKKDPELLKKAIEAQRSAMPQNDVRSAGGSPMVLILLVLGFCLLIVVSLWIVFEKAGHSGWKSLIPFYNAYILMEISGKPGWWMFLLLIPVVSLVFYLLAMLDMAKKFGRGALFGVGLCFLPMFCFPMLAFGGAKYEG